jgi:hypothetical protein
VLFLNCLKFIRFPAALVRANCTIGDYCGDGMKQAGETCADRKPPQQ